MVYAILAVLAGFVAGIVFSIIKTNAKWRLTILMMLLSKRESDREGYMEITLGSDQDSIERLLEKMTRQGFLEKSMLVPSEGKIRTFYRLTDEGYRFAVELRHQLRRHR